MLGVFLNYWRRTRVAEKQAAGNFVLASDCELKSPGVDSASIRMKKQDLTAEEIDAHLYNKDVAQLGLIWADKVKFILTADFTFKSVQFLDVIQEQASNEGEDKESLLAAMQLIMTETLGQMIDELVEHLGGFTK